MPEVRDATAELISEQPELESAVRTLLEVETEEPWQFDDVPLDTGEFGELVSAGLLEKRNSGYVLADRNQIEAVIEGSDHANTGLFPGRVNEIPLVGTYVAARWRTVVDNRVDATILLVLLTITGLVRTVPSYGSVFRRGHTIIAGNDPYLFVYWVEYLLNEGFQPFDPGSLAAFPDALINHDLLLVVAVWVTATIFGGSTATADVLLAWYPVVASVFVAGLLYLIATGLTADRRVGLATVAVFAFTPVAAYRMMIGFADHDAIDFLFLTITVLSVVLIATSDEDALRESRLKTTTLIVALGVGVAAQLIAWRGGPLLVLPLAIALAALVISMVRSGASVRPLLASVATAMVVASVLTMTPHLAFGWLPLYRAAVPLMALGGVFGLGIFAGAVRHYSISFRTAVAGVTILSGLALVGAWAFVPSLSAGIQGFLDYMATYTWSEIGETRSLFDAGTGGIVFGPFLLLGFTWLLGLGGLVALSVITYRRHTPGWLVLVVYGWFFLAMAIVQKRFAGQFALFNAVFAGITFVHLTALMDLSQPVQWVPAAEERAGDGVRAISIPGRGTLIRLGTIFLLVSSLGMHQTELKQSQLVTDDERYDAATFIETFAAERAMSYPENYVLSLWGRNRLFNHVVSGESLSYRYAKSNYISFLAMNNATRAFEQYKDRVGFVVTRNFLNSMSPPPRSMQTRLHDKYGSLTDAAPALTHFRAIYTTPDRSITISQLVPGARVDGTGPANQTVTVTTTVTLPPAGKTITYEQHVETDTNGTFRFVTPYPGSYTIAGENVTVDERSVLSGSTVNVSNGTTG